MESGIINHTARARAADKTERAARADIARSRGLVAAAAAAVAHFDHLASYRPTTTVLLLLPAPRGSSSRLPLLQLGRTEHQEAMPFWWPWRRSRPRPKRKDGGPVPASASASCSPRHSVDVVVPPTAYASASASPSAQWERAWTRSLVSPAPAAPRGADRAAAPATGGGSGPGGAAAGRGRGLPLPLPVYKSARGGSPVSSGSSSESDEVADSTNYRYKILHLRGVLCWRLAASFVAVVCTFRVREYSENDAISLCPMSLHDYIDEPLW